MTLNSETVSEDILKLMERCTSLRNMVADSPSKVKKKLKELEELSESIRALYDTVLPLDAGEQAKKSLVYQLSQTVFGSLLAAYILGFIGFAVSKLPNGSDVGPWQVIYQVVPYILVSVAFAYSTAAAFLTYHEIVVASPAPSPDRVGLDWLIPLLQGIFFGITMLFPEWLAVMLVAQLLLLSYRGNIERKGICKTINRILDHRLSIRERITAWEPQKHPEEKNEQEREEARHCVPRFILHQLSIISWDPGELTNMKRAITLNVIACASSTLLGICFFYLYSDEPPISSVYVFRLFVIAAMFYLVRSLYIGIRAVQKRWRKSLEWLPSERKREPWGIPRLAILFAIFLVAVQWMVLSINDQNWLRELGTWNGLISTDFIQLLVLAALTSFIITNSGSAIMASAGFADKGRYHLEDDGKGLSGLEAIQLEFIEALIKMEAVLATEPWTKTLDYRKW